MWHFLISLRKESVASRKQTYILLGKEEKQPL